MLLEAYFAQIDGILQKLSDVCICLLLLFKYLIYIISLHRSMEFSCIGFSSCYRISVVKSMKLFQIMIKLQLDMLL